MVQPSDLSVTAREHEPKAPKTDKAGCDAWALAAFSIVIPRVLRYFYYDSGRMWGVVSTHGTT